MYPQGSAESLLLPLVVLSIGASIALAVACIATIRPGEQTVLKSPGFWVCMGFSLFFCALISVGTLGTLLVVRLARRHEEQQESQRREVEQKREETKRAAEAEQGRKALEIERGARERQRVADDRARARRRDARAACDLLYLQLAPDIGDRFTRPMYDEWLKKYLTDTHPPEEVERRAEQLQVILRQHHAQATEPDQRRREEEERRKQQEAESQELLRKMIEQTAADQQAAAAAAAREKSLAEKIQAILRSNYPAEVRERKIAELLQGVDVPEPGGKPEPVTGDEE